MADRTAGDLIGTLRNSWRFALAMFRSNGLTAARTYDMPDKSGTVALTSDVALAITDEFGDFIGNETHKPIGAAP